MVHQRGRFFLNVSLAMRIGQLTVIVWHCLFLSYFNLVVLVIWRKIHLQITYSNCVVCTFMLFINCLMRSFVYIFIWFPILFCISINNRVKIVHWCFLHDITLLTDVTAAGKEVCCLLSDHGPSKYMYFKCGCLCTSPFPDISFTTWK